MCHELEVLRYEFNYDPDDSDGGVFIGNYNYDRFKVIVEHIANCNLCLSEGWRSYAGPRGSHPRDGKLWYGNVYRDERIADRYFWLMGIDLENGTRPSVHGSSIDRKAGWPSDQGSDLLNRTSAEFRVALQSRLRRPDLNSRTYHKSRGSK